MINFNLQVRNFPFNDHSQAAIEAWKNGQNTYGTNWPVVYFIHDDDSREAYVGETLHAGKRADEHWRNTPARRQLKVIHIVTDDTFNKSVILDLESFLIKYIAADGKYKLQNGNGGLADYNYYKCDEYRNEFGKVWDKLKELNLVRSNIADIQNSDLFKYSPYKTLTDDQQQVMNQVLFYISGYLKLHVDQTIIVEGGAGTGKTILAVFLFKLLTDLSNNTFERNDVNEETDVDTIQALIRPENPLKIGFVVPQQSLRETLKNVFASIQGLSADMVLNPADVVKAANDKPFDLLICDEAHRLRRRWAMNGFALHRFDENNDALGISRECTELDWIIKCSHMQLLFYDSDQTVKPTDIPTDYFSNTINQRSKIVLHLTSQLRCLGGNNYIDYIKAILNDQHPDPILHFDQYDLRFFDDVDQMVDNINSRNSEVGLSCTVAGYAWKWKTKGQANPVERDINIGRGYIWNRKEIDWINSKPLPYEVGCIHTAQGYDLNYVGVIFGPEITYDKTNQRIDVIRENYKDDKGKCVSGDHEALREFIINIYATLMTRGIRGTYIYVCDPDLREYLRPFFVNQ